MKTTVAIIGGGFAGLHTAQLLERTGIDYRLLEARNHLHARIRSGGLPPRPNHHQPTGNPVEKIQKSPFGGGFWSPYAGFSPSF